MKENLVYHYTRLDALKSILGQTICLWATRYDKLNDPSEQIWAEKYIIESIKKLPEFKYDSSKQIINWQRKDGYILSLSKYGDDRNMWRLYCDDGKGVCLILDKDILQSSCRQQMEKNYADFYCLLEEVEYVSSEKVADAVAKCKEKGCFNIGNEEIASRMMRIVPFIKNEDFRVENEVRCAILRECNKIIIPYDKEKKGPGKPIFSENKNNIKYRMRGNDLVPYLEIHLPIEALKGITIGYEVDEDKAKEYIYSILGANSKYKDIPVEKSKLFSTVNQKKYNESFV